MCPGNSLAEVARNWMVASAALAALVGGLSGSATAGPVTALVPAYFYPTPNSPWQQLNEAAGVISVEAIMNPASGPGSAPNSDYVAAVDALRTAGGRVIGYVSTAFGARTLDAVMADIDAYLSWYNVDGIFLDEMGNVAGDLNYASVYQYIKDQIPQIGRDLRVVGNAGIPFPQVEPYMQVTDTLVIFEGPLTNADPNGASFENYPDQGPYAGLPPWFLNYSSDKVANLVYEVPTADAMRAALDKAVLNNAGYVYFTDDTLFPDFNPWDTLPSYWNEQVAAIAAIPEPSSLILVESGGLLGAGIWVIRRMRVRRMG